MVFGEQFLNSSNENSNVLYLNNDYNNDDTQNNENDGNSH